MKYHWISIALTCVVCNVASQTKLFAEVLTVGQPTELEVIITAVQGLVQVRGDTDQDWQVAKEQMKLGAGAEFRTGPRSAVQFMIPPDQTITLDRLGTLKVLTAIKLANGKVKTDLGMKYGRTRYDIEAAGIEHAATVHMPSANLSVRGTRVGAQQDFEGRAWSTQNRAQFTGINRPTFTIGPGSEIGGGSNGPSDDRLNRDRIDPRDARSRARNEHRLLDHQLVGDFDDSGSGVGGVRHHDRMGTINFMQTIPVPVIGTVRTSDPSILVNIFTTPNSLPGDQAKIFFNGNVLENALVIQPLSNGGTQFDLNLNGGVNLFTAESVSVHLDAAIRAPDTTVGALFTFTIDVNSPARKRTLAIIRE